MPGEATWPRMIVLDEDTEDRLINWLHEEIHRAWTEREPLLDDWVKWQAQYWATPSEAVKNWPFPRAANIVIPLTAIAVEAIYARLFNTLFTPRFFYSIRPKATPWIDPAPHVEQWLQTEVENPDALNMERFCQNALMELAKLGTCVGKSGYERTIRKSIRERGGEESEYYHTVKNGATLDWVPLANFMIRLKDHDPQDAPWVGEEHIFSWAQLKRMSEGGRMDPDAIEEVKTYFMDRSREHAGEAQTYQEDVDEISNQEPIWYEQFKVQEIWCSFDVDGDGIDEEIVIDFHWQSKSVLSVRYNWYSDLHRPYRIGNYIPVEGRIYGIGVGKQNEQFQEEVTTIHRQRLDNSTLANMGMLALKKNSGYGPKEPIFPGKMWFLDDPQDIAPVKLSEIYNSAYANEDIVNTYSEKRTGVNEVILGQPQSGTPGTATGDIARLQEGNKRFDMVLRNVRRFLSLIGTDLLANYQQFGDQDRHFMILGDDGVFVEQILSLPPQLVRIGAIVDVTATSSTVNKDVEQRQWLALMQILERYYQGNIQLAAMLDPQLAAQMAQAAIMASGEAVRRLLLTFDVQDAEKLLVQGQGGQNGGRPGGAPAQLGPGGPGGLPPGGGPQGVANIPPPA